MPSQYTRNLLQRVIDNSDSKVWDLAVKEWEITDCIEDDSLSESCICGKEHLYYLFAIRNIINGNILYPIGSKCIKKFNNQKMSTQADIQEQLFRLYHAITNCNFITLSKEYFSRKLLLYFYQQNVFDCDYNNFDGENDYMFMLKMFNKKDKANISRKQQKKINAIIIKQILPYLRERLRGKTVHFQ